MKYKTGKVIKKIKNDEDISLIAKELSIKYEQRIRKDNDRTNPSSGRN